MKCCGRYVSQTFATNTFRFAIFSSKKPFPTRVFIHRKFFNHFVNIFGKKTAGFFLIFQNKNTSQAFARHSPAKTRNKRGPSTEPCGTPNVTGSQFE